MSSKIMLEYVNCTLCEKDNTELLFVGKDRLHHKEGEFRVVKCKNCGLIYTNPRPTKEQMAYYYPEDYSPFSAQPPHLMNQGHGISAIAKNNCKKYILGRHYHYPFSIKWNSFKIMLAKIFHGYFKRHYWRIPLWYPNGKVLDFGCGNGWYLSFLKNLGWETYGIDTSSKAAKYAQEKYGIKVFCGLLKNMGFSENFFDVVTMWHSLEHSFDPFKVLLKTNALLKKGGRLYIATPNVQSLTTKLFKAFSFPIQLPTHLFHFSADVLKQMLQETKFRIIEIKYLPSNIGFLKSLSYLLEEYGYNISLDNKFLIWLSTKLGGLFARIHQGDQLFIIAEKI